jgi:hypothetical protein
VVTSLKGSAEHLYENVYCQRGQMENLIKMHNKAQMANTRVDPSPLLTVWPMPITSSSVKGGGCVYPRINGRLPLKRHLSQGPTATVMSPCGAWPRPSIRVTCSIA